MKDRICHYKYNSTETEQIELHLVRTHISVVVLAGYALKTRVPAKNDICNMSLKTEQAELTNNKTDKSWIKYITLTKIFAYRSTLSGRAIITVYLIYVC